MQITVETARAIEDALANVIQLAEGTKLISEQYLKNLKTMQRNVSVRFFTLHTIDTPSEGTRPRFNKKSAERAKEILK